MKIRITVHLEGTDSGNHYSCIGLEAAVSAFDVHELLAADVRAKA